MTGGGVGRSFEGGGGRAAGWTGLDPGGAFVGHEGCSMRGTSGVLTAAGMHQEACDGMQPAQHSS